MSIVLCTCGVRVGGSGWLLFRCAARRLLHCAVDGPSLRFRCCVAITMGMLWFYKFTRSCDSDGVVAVGFTFLLYHAALSYFLLFDSLLFPLFSTVSGLSVVVVFLLWLLCFVVWYCYCFVSMCRHR